MNFPATVPDADDLVNPWQDAEGEDLTYAAEAAAAAAD